jgi:multisubunit Na+/H+ antiporter MnhF subunit
MAMQRLAKIILIQLIVNIAALFTSYYIFHHPKISDNLINIEILSIILAVFFMAPALIFSKPSKLDFLLLVILLPAFHLLAYFFIGCGFFKDCI